MVFTDAPAGSLRDQVVRQVYPGPGELGSKNLTLSAEIPIPQVEPCFYSQSIWVTCHPGSCCWLAEPLFLISSAVVPG